ncbi:hypothetical protein BABINDRAFT_163657 [Babjeviella inositovora NRRL Y-12698]|uniref:Uncharacterized protein n=1 Tax=Babjeviella inositovora NRRL Y-12698 TaxID=984486 RepID=A0A1E3QIY3_9ASCO|nr:uncharacterized protein BABINDRAFT_163657 [Babjeviella inositovora NRRL Y-12698]ODQ77414.1 hypothetical protein BABINDRAFT_163657 [Babjeviella inositovora NRRL Y-12698]
MHNVQDNHFPGDGSQKRPKNLHEYEQRTQCAIYGSKLSLPRLPHLLCTKITYEAITAA